MVFALFKALASIFRKRTNTDEFAAFREAISIVPDDDFYPTSADVTARLEATGAFKVEAIGWIAEAICQGARDGRGYRQIETGVRDQGAPLSAERKKALGLRSNYRIGDRFAEACQIGVKEAAHRVFLVTQAASSQAILRNSRRRWKEAGVTHVRLMPCNDERDCETSRHRRDERMRVDEAELPLTGCDAEYCRCTFRAEVRIGSEIF